MLYFLFLSYYIKSNYKKKIIMLSKKGQIEIKSNFPSICYDCKNARKPASEENIKKGYVGCCGRAIKEPYNFDYDAILFGEIGEGWVDLRANVFGENSGVISNCQLLTLKVSNCSKFERET